MQSKISEPLLPLRVVMPVLWTWKRSILLNEAGHGFIKTHGSESRGQ